MYLCLLVLNQLVLRQPRCEFALASVHAFYHGLAAPKRLLSKLLWLVRGEGTEFSGQAPIVPSRTLFSMRPKRKSTDARHAVYCVQCALANRESLYILAKLPIDTTLSHI